MKRYAVGLLLLASSAAAQAPPARQPRLLNGAELRGLLDRNYPRELRMNGVSGTNRVRVFVSAAGKPDSAYISITSGSRRLDAAALELAHKMMFAPAADTSLPGTWLDVPFGFVPDGSSPLDSALPVLVNRSDVESLLHQRYDQVRGRGNDEYDVSMVIDVDDQGVPAAVTTYERSCEDRLDDLARAAALAMRFAPAAGRSNVWFSFSRDSAFMQIAGDTLPAPKPSRDTLQPRTGDPVRPLLRNRDYVARRLVELYPRPLRNAHIGGEVVLWALVNEKGEVEKRRVRTSSGYCEFDQAARRVSSFMRFSPGEIGGDRVKMWVQLPIIFRIFP